MEVQRGRRVVDHKRASYFLVLAAALAAGLPTLYPTQFFLADDFAMVQQLHQGIYGMHLDALRSVPAISFRLDSFLFGATNAMAYHATNVLLHCLNSLLVCAIVLAMSPTNRWVGLIAGVLFAILPCHAETIAWISGRVDSWATLLYLGSFLCFVRFRQHRSAESYFISLGLFALGLFAKQTVVTLPILLLAYEWIYGMRGRFAWRMAAHVPFLAVLMLYLALRKILFGNAVREDLLHFGLFAEFARRQAFYAKGLLPFALDYSHPVRVAIGATTVSIVAALLWSRAANRAKYAGTVRQVLFFGPVWYAITVSPMIVTYTSARHLYLTAAGVSIAFALLILPDGKDRVTARAGILGCLIVLYGAAFAGSIQPWVENGVTSDKISSAVPRAMRSIPRGSTVFVAVPPMRHNVPLWSFALPFALQPPFDSEDLYGRFNVVEYSEAYCCPSQQWIRHEQPILLRLTDGQPANKGIYVVSEGQLTGELAVAQRAVNGPELKAKIEGVLRKPLESPDLVIGREDAARVSAVLFSDLITGP